MPIDPDLLPALADIGAILHSRTTTGGSDEAGTFTANTHPTGTQVQALIDLVAPGIIVQLPETIDDRLNTTVKLAIALTTAIMVERSYFTEQVSQDPTTVEGLEAQLALLMAGLVAASRDDQPGGNRAYGVPIGTVVAASSPFSTDLLP